MHHDSIQHMNEVIRTIQGRVLRLNRITQLIFTVAAGQR